MALFSPINEILQAYDQPFYRRPIHPCENLFLQQQLGEWVHQIYLDQKKLNQLTVMRLIEHPLQSLKPNIACSVIYTIIRDKVQEVCRMIRKIIIQSYRRLMERRQVNNDMKHISDSWNVNFYKFSRQIYGNNVKGQGQSKYQTKNLNKVYGPAAHIICTYHNYLLDANKQIYDLWRVLYQCSDVKDLQFKTLQSSLNELILEELMRDYPENEMLPREIMPTLSSMEKHQFIFKEMWGFQKRKAVVQFNVRSKDENIIQVEKQVVQMKIAEENKANQQIINLNSSKKGQKQKQRQRQKQKQKQRQKTSNLLKIPKPIDSFFKQLIGMTNDSQISQQQSSKQQLTKQTRKLIKQQWQLSQLKRKVQSLDAETRDKLYKEIQKNYLMKINGEKGVDMNLVSEEENIQEAIIGKLSDRERLILHVQDINKASQALQSASSSDDDLEQTKQPDNHHSYRNYDHNGENDQECLQQQQQQQQQQDEQQQGYNRFFIDDDGNCEQKILARDQFMMELEKIKDSLNRTNYQKEFIDLNYFKSEHKIKQEKRNKKSKPLKKINKPIQKNEIQSKSSMSEGLSKNQFKFREKDRLNKKLITISHHEEEMPHLIPISKKRYNLNYVTNNDVNNNDMNKGVLSYDELRESDEMLVETLRGNHDVENRVLGKKLSKRFQEKQFLTLNCLKNQIFKSGRSVTLKQSQDELLKEFRIITEEKQRHLHHFENSKNFTLNSKIQISCKKIVSEKNGRRDEITRITGLKSEYDGLQWIPDFSDGQREYILSGKDRMDYDEELIDQPNYQINNDDKQEKKKKKKKKKRNKNKKENVQQNNKGEEKSDGSENQDVDFQGMKEHKNKTDLLTNQEMQKMRQQELLMQKKLQAYEKGVPEMRRVTSKENKASNRQIFNQNQMKLFKFLQSLQIKEQNRQKCIVTEQTLQKILYKRKQIKTKQLFSRRVQEMEKNSTNEKNTSINKQKTNSILSKGKDENDGSQQKSMNKNNKNKNKKKRK